MAERGLPARRLALGALILLLASLLQFHHLTRDQRFLPDEAFFMTFARGAAVNGDWLLPGALDKPPLSLYLSALSMAAVSNTADAAGVLRLDPHVGEFAGALPNVMLAILLTALMMRLARRVWRDEPAGLLAGLLTAISPYMLAFGASAFTDLSMLIFSVAALVLALDGRWALAGLALGLAFWGKQQAVFAAVPILAILVAHGERRGDWLRFLLPLSAIIAALLLWDAARPETSVFLQAAANNAPESWLAPPSDWLTRLMDWLGRGAWLLGPPLATAGLLALSALGFVGRAGQSRRTATTARVLVGGLSLYLGAHAVLGFNLYDRYLLLALPPLIMLAAGGLSAICRRFGRSHFKLIPIAVALLSAVWSVSNGSRVGESRKTQAGIDALAAHLNSKPVATVIYDPWLGWQLGYYLGQWHDKRRVHYPTADALVAGALALDETGDRYFVAPADQPHEDWLAALRAAGVEVNLDYEREGFRVYRLSPQKLSPKKLRVFRLAFRLY